MVDSRQKGARIELQIRDKLRLWTGLNWERIPSSGALDAKHGLKGDLYVPKRENLYCVEVKGYKDDHLNSKILHNKSNMETWWAQAQRQAEEVDMHPMLIYKFDRSKIFAVLEEPELPDCSPKLVPCISLRKPGLNVEIVELEKLCKVLNWSFIV